MVPALVTGKLLLVEDDRPTRDLLESALSQAGFIVTPAATGTEALTLIRRDQFDLIVLDPMLPWISGFGVLETLRAGRPAAPLPVIVITGMAVQSTEFQPYGQVAILHKPFDPDRLVATVKRMLYGDVHTAR